MKFLRPIEDNILAKFSKWKGESISMADRLTLINSAISGALNYKFMIYKWPVSLLKEMESATRRFFWTGSIFKNKLISVAWAKTCVPRNEGGLGMRSLRAVNEGFMANLAWRIMTPNTLASNFLQNKYVSEFGKFRSGVEGFRSQGHWNLPQSFRNTFLCISKDIDHVIIANASSDELIWMPCSTGKPKTKDFYDHLHPRRGVVNWGNKIWRKGNQPRIQV
ncbi:hypothetical protein TIFTF001_041761 [Ficus carica]|uniref:Uncharacterized protein n=1 Tax=Ficus carica TaxID=3494 RepID=A0AA87ZUY3_FICCA|nr:hypothetical protein TIFTF001_041761 [Ficus carica]